MNIITPSRVEQSEEERGVDLSLHVSGNEYYVTSTALKCSM
jgi:hypothetical protein